MEFGVDVDNNLAVVEVDQGHERLVKHVQSNSEIIFIYLFVMLCKGSPTVTSPNRVVWSITIVCICVCVLACKLCSLFYDF